jgi:hypothetical protein
MTLFELVQAVNGEITNGEARVRVDGEWVVLGTFDVMSEAGKEMAAKLAPKAAPKKATTKK